VSSLSLFLYLSREKYGRLMPGNSVNFGQGRLIPRSEEGALIHRSVKLRMDRDPKYKWKAIGDTKPIWWVFPYLLLVFRHANFR
jgi:hypothetical protein